MTTERGLMPTHAERQIVPYRPDQLFDLVADVGKYPQFLPWCVAARVRSRTERELVADLTIGFGPFRETFASRVILDRPQRVKVRYVDPQHGQPVLREQIVNFAFHSRILQAAIGLVFNEAVRRMVGAFGKRARDVYGTPAVADAAPEAVKS